MPTTSTITNVQGINSGIQWNDIVDATIKAEEARTLKPLTDRMDAQAKAKDAWGAFTALVQTLSDTARVVRRAGLGGYTATVPPSPTTSRTIQTAGKTECGCGVRHRLAAQLRGVGELLHFDAIAPRRCGQRGGRGQNRT